MERREEKASNGCEDGQGDDDAVNEGGDGDGGSDSDDGDGGRRTRTLNLVGDVVAGVLDGIHSDEVVGVGVC